MGLALHVGRIRQHTPVAVHHRDLVREGSHPAPPLEPVFDGELMELGDPGDLALPDAGRLEQGDVARDPRSPITMPSRRCSSLTLTVSFIQRTTESGRCG